MTQVVRILEMLLIFVVICFFKFCYTSTVETSEALDRLKTCGFFDYQLHNSDLNDEDLTDKITGIREFQIYAGLKDTGYLNGETVEAILALRCEDLIAEKRNLSRAKRYTLEGSKWPKKNLTYSFVSYPPNLRKEDVESEIRRAFDEWSKYADLTFTQVNNSADVDIKIEFTRFNHKDSYPFDGLGVDLAHGFYPTYGGDIHFDNSERWTIGREEGINLFETAVHEIGHALGVDHSSVKAAVMWPTVHGYNASFGLHQDEIDAIRSLYGPKFNRTLKTNDMLCEYGGVDAAILGRDHKIYLFKENFYYYLDECEPKLIQDKWTGLLGNIDAAFTDNLGKTFFFTGDRYWRFSGFKLDTGYPRDISQGFPGIPNSIDAAFSNPGPINELYFFKGDMFWKYVRANTPHVSKEYPKLISEVWKGVPDNLDAAVKNHDGIIFIKGLRSYVVSGIDRLNSLEEVFAEMREIRCPNANASNGET